MSHSRTQCKHGVLISQCRCPSPDKTIVIAPCPDRCKAPKDDLREVVARAMHHSISLDKSEGHYQFCRTVYLVYADAVLKAIAEAVL